MSVATHYYAGAGDDPYVVDLNIVDGSDPDRWIEVFFSEPMLGLGTAGNFTVDGGVTVNATTPAGDDMSVVLDVSTLVLGQSYVLTFGAGVTDALGNPVSPTNVSFFAGNAGGAAELDLLAGQGLVEHEPRQDLFGTAGGLVQTVTVVDPGNLIPPITGNFDPPAGTTIAATSSVAFDVTDDENSFARIFVTAYFAQLGDEEVVHDGDGFRPRYAPTSSRVPIANGFRYTVARYGGWPSSPTFRVFPIDSSGNQ